MKKIEIKHENIVMNLLKKGFKVEGRLWLEETEDGELIIWFDRYNRKPQPKQRNWLIRRLEHGWVKESVERIKVYESIPKEIGMPRILAVIDRETKEAKEALIDHELDLLFAASGIEGNGDGTDSPCAEIAEQVLHRILREDTYVFLHLHTEVQQRI